MQLVKKNNYMIYKLQTDYIGIRVEDDVLISKDEPTILTQEAPKDIEDIESACNVALST